MLVRFSTQKQYVSTAVIFTKSLSWFRQVSEHVLNVSLARSSARVVYVEEVLESLPAPSYTDYNVSPENADQVLLVQFTEIVLATANHLTLELTLTAT